MINWICANYKPEYQLIWAFIFGLIFSPFGSAFAIVVLWYVLYEMMYMCIMYKCPKWTMEARFIVLCVGILGWVLGRYLLGKDIFPEFNHDNDDNKNNNNK
jgi:hypothetical protein